MALMFWALTPRALSFSYCGPVRTSLVLIQHSPSIYRLIQWIPDVPRDLSWLSSLAGDLYRHTMEDEDQEQDLDR